MSARDFETSAGAQLVADKFDGSTNPVPVGEQASAMSGCGCLILIAVFIGPLVTNWVGLSPWPVPTAFGLALVVAWFSKSNPFPFPRFFLLIMLFIGLIGGSVFGRSVAEDSARVAAAPPPAPAPTAEPTQSANPAALPTVQKEVVRITLDEIIDKFAENQIAGEQFFETRTALIPGVAVRVREALGMGVLVVRAPKAGREVEMGFNERGTRQLGEVKPGDRFEASCSSIWEAMSQVIITCENISVQSGK